MVMTKMKSILQSFALGVLVVLLALTPVAALGFLATAI
jgi:hypothetical protein